MKFMRIAIYVNLGFAVLDGCQGNWLSTLNCLFWAGSSFYCADALRKARETQAWVRESHQRPAEFWLHRS
jgi:hypothetical protein